MILLLFITTGLNLHSNLNEENLNLCCLLYAVNCVTFPTTLKAPLLSRHIAKKFLDCSRHVNRDLELLVSHAEGQSQTDPLAALAH